MFLTVCLVVLSLFAADNNDDWDLAVDLVGFFVMGLDSLGLGIINVSYSIVIG